MIAVKYILSRSTSTYLSTSQSPNQLRHGNVDVPGQADAAKDSKVN